MRKLRLNQPYASMVVAGALETIHDIWGDVKYGEKIFIYADEVATRYADGLDYERQLDRKILNEMLYGNIPGIDEEFPIDAFIGYVIVHFKGDYVRYWGGENEKYLFVSHNHSFKYPIEDFDISYSELDAANAYPSRVRRMKRVGGELQVPVGEGAWNILRNKEEYKNVYMFWEDYMDGIVPPLMSDYDREPIYYVSFIHNSQRMIFDTNLDTGQSLGTKLIPLFLFDLSNLSIRSKVSFKKERQSSSQGGKSQWIRMISVPMGGMTRWKRR